MQGRQPRVHDNCPRHSRERQRESANLTSEKDAKREGKRRRRSSGSVDISTSRKPHNRHREQDLHEYRNAVQGGVHNRFTEMDPLAMLLKVKTSLSDMCSWYQTRDNQPRMETVQLMQECTATVEEIQRQAIIMVDIAERIIQQGLLPGERPIQCEPEI